MTFTLLYHDIAAPDSSSGDGFEGPSAARYKLTPELFESHLDAIEKTGVQIGVHLPGVKPPSAALSFDDGGASAMLAAEALERRGWRGHFFITTGRIGVAGFLSAAAIVELSQRGHVVGSHSHTHPTYFGRLASTQLDREWRQSRAVLGDLLGAPPLTASVPGGLLSAAVLGRAADAGYRILMTSEPVARIGAHGPMSVVGRFAIRSSTPPERAAAYARGHRLARARTWLAWNAKQRAKRLSPRAFEALRRGRGTAP